MPIERSAARKAAAYQKRLEAVRRIKERRQRMLDHFANLIEGIGPAIAEALATFRNPAQAVTLLQGVIDSLEQDHAEADVPSADTEEALKTLRLLVEELDEIDIDALAESSPLESTP